MKRIYDCNSQVPRGEHNGRSSQHHWTLLRASLPSGFRSDVAVQGVCPALSWGSDFETSIPPSMLRRLRYYRRRLERTAAIRIDVARGVNFEAIFADLLRLHQARWKARGQSGALAYGPVTQFHHEGASALMREGALRLYSLSIDGRTAASFYGFQLRGRTFYYLGGFAPEFESRNVGTVLVGYAIEQAVREGSNEFSFLRGSETYKLPGARGTTSITAELSIKRHNPKTCGHLLMILVLDLDRTLNRLHPSWVSSIRDLAPAELRAENGRAFWDWIITHLTEVEYSPHQPALDILDVLAADASAVVINTGRPEALRRVSEHWLQRFLRVEGMENPLALAGRWARIVPDFGQLSYQRQLRPKRIQRATTFKKS